MSITVTWCEKFCSLLYSYLHVLKAHPGTCLCIEFDPTGRYFATGSADGLVCLWGVDELACLRTFSR